MIAIESQELVRRVLAQTALWTLVTGAVLFGAAGTLSWPEAWVFLGLWIAGGLMSGLSLARTNPEILKERMRSPLQKDQKRWDRPLFFAIWRLGRATGRRRPGRQAFRM